MTTEQAKKDLETFLTSIDVSFTMDEQGISFGEIPNKHMDEFMELMDKLYEEDINGQ